ncbi:MAG: recombination mediator RecR [Campylobacteraceae bacterium]|jgi:recombination protein RecR|nr:recombination mediator RecR [Campylobacteraceae bacterium]
MRRLQKFNQLIEAFAVLPTVGKKSALRFAYHLVLKDTFGAMKLAHAIEDAVQTIRRCECCGGVSEHEICEICLDENRNNGQLCIVESAKDIFILEEHKLFLGRYFVFDSLKDDRIEDLKKVIYEAKVKEVIFAFTPSLASDAIILFIEDKLQDLNLSFTKIAQGVPTGVQLENVDMLSLSKALEARTKV